MVRSRRSRKPAPDPGKGRVSREEAEPERFRWIVDGHNAIFKTAAWEALQVAGRRGEARRALEQSLQAFGRAAGVQVWVVYDGNGLERNPDIVEGPHLRSEYSCPPEVADDRIRFLAEQALRRGERPIVVTSDQRTLARSLSAEVRVIDVPGFLRGICRRIQRRPEKWSPSENLEDVERHFLRRSPHPDDRELAVERETEDRHPGLGEIDAPRQSEDEGGAA